MSRFRLGASAHKGLWKSRNENESFSHDRTQAEAIKNNRIPFQSIAKQNQTALSTLDWNQRTIYLRKWSSTWYSFPIFASNFVRQVNIRSSPRSSGAIHTANTESRFRRVFQFHAGAHSRPKTLFASDMLFEFLSPALFASCATFDCATFVFMLRVCRVEKVCFCTRVICKSCVHFIQTVNNTE